MILQELRIRRIGAFYDEAVLEVDPEVTVLTGPNDTGKSTILNLLKWLSVPSSIGQSHVNLDYLQADSEIPWNQDPTIAVEATFVECGADGYIAQEVPEDSRIVIEYHGPTSRRNVIGITDEWGKNVDITEDSVFKLPEVIVLQTGHTLRQEIPLDNPTQLERSLLSLALGSNYMIKFPVLDEPTRKRHIRQANRTINARLETLRSSGFKEEIVIDDTNAGFTISLRDGHQSDVPLQSRGAGLQKIIRILVALQSMESDKHIIITLDEPENSLHADAQHKFRRVLETVAKSPRIQVIYATHSSAMMNSAYPRRIRLLTRGQNTQDGTATAHVNNKPYADDNFQLIRSSLGITPADSLLYAPISVIIEGATESLGLNRLFRRLIDESEDEKYGDLKTLVALIHFLPAGGSSFVRWTRMAHSQGAKPIIIVDGDQVNNLKALRREFPCVPIVHFDETKEIEDIVSRAAYFKALAEYAALNNPQSSIEVSEQAFNRWEDEQEFNQKVLFSKRVAKWYRVLFDYDMEKAEVMHSAIKQVKLEDIDMSKIDELLDAIRAAADNLH